MMDSPTINSSLWGRTTTEFHESGAACSTFQMIHLTAPLCFYVIHPVNLDHLQWASFLTFYSHLPKQIQAFQPQ
jgi:hypothetical protein